MSGRRHTIGLAGIAIVPIACCLGLPLLAAAGVGAVAPIAGIAAGGLVLIAAAALVARTAMTKKSEEVLVEHDCCAPTPAGEISNAEPPPSGRERPLVEILYFDGCPNHEAARELVDRVSRELGVQPELRLVNVPDEEEARRLRFLGSPTVRVAGRDVDPHAGERDEYVLSCRVYRTDSGFAGQPDERWVREALQREASSFGDILEEV